MLDTTDQILMEVGGLIQTVFWHLTFLILIVPDEDTIINGPIFKKWRAITATAAGLVLMKYGMMMQLVPYLPKGSLYYSWSVACLLILKIKCILPCIK